MLLSQLSYAKKIPFKQNNQSLKSCFSVSQSTVSPVCLPSPDDEELLPGAPLTVAGWGARQERKGDYPDRLHEVTVEFSNQTSCAASYRHLRVDIGQFLQLLSCMSITHDL